jgi:hypothetical protein
VLKHDLSDPTLLMHVSMHNVEGHAWCMLLLAVEARDPERRFLVQRRPTICIVLAWALKCKRRKLTARVLWFPCSFNVPCWGECRIQRISMVEQHWEPDSSTIQLFIRWLRVIRQSEPSQSMTETWRSPPSWS